ncbi:hypothetical protein K502DRAFT_349986 [Neoconidiobolus thromboides FSU 785]|nr:hypothetical protein K502DRAFT_349986 [Neoconidiobolus thromboides FSU 785]
MKTSLIALSVVSLVSCAVLGPKKALNTNVLPEDNNSNIPIDALDITSLLDGKPQSFDPISKPSNSAKKVENTATIPNLTFIPETNKSTKEDKKEDKKNNYEEKEKYDKYNRDEEYNDKYHNKYSKKEYNDDHYDSGYGKEDYSRSRNYYNEDY